MSTRTMMDQERTDKTPANEQPDDDSTVVIEVGDSASAPPADGEPTGDTERQAPGDTDDEPAGDGGDEPAGDGGDESAGDGGDEPAGDGGDEPASDGGDEPAGDGGDEPAGDGGDESAGDGEAAVPLAERLEAARAEAAARHDAWIRAMAEIENLRKRGARERTEQVRRARESVLCEFLTVVDDVERAIGAIDQTDLGPEAESLRHGVELIHTRLLEVLAGFDVRPLECAGEVFDPHQHEAVMRDESSDLEPDHITQVIQQGYRIGERVLRPARVAVSG